MMNSGKPWTAHLLGSRLALRAANLRLLGALFLDLFKGGSHDRAVELRRLARTGDMKGDIHSGMGERQHERLRRHCSNLGAGLT